MTFVLRREHEEAIAAAIFARFLDRGTRVLRQKHGAILSEVPDHVLKAVLHKWCNEARHYGFFSEKHFLRYARAVIVTAGLDASKPDLPYLDTVVGDTSIDADHRSAVLLEQSLAQNCMGKRL
ncbi:MAG: hypothetical protein SFZ23_13735 [Planctomycetota bacterium]|nr:hypothetical protein [Planctomycetota bacterium]